MMKESEQTRDKNPFYKLPLTKRIIDLIVSIHIFTSPLIVRKTYVFPLYR